MLTLSNPPDCSDWLDQISIISVLLLTSLCCSLLHGPLHLMASRCTWSRCSDMDASECSRAVISVFTQRQRVRLGIGIVSVRYSTNRVSVVAESKNRKRPPPVLTMRCGYLD